MKIRKSTGRNHVWQRKTHRVEVDGKEQEAKSCSRCGMERTRDMSTTRWYAFNAGVLPACERPALLEATP